MQLVFHLPGLPHLPIRKEISMCAFTQKISRLAHMLKSKGHIVYVYGIESSEADCHKLIDIVTLKEYNDSKYIKYNWKKEFFKFDDYEFNTLFNDRLIQSIEQVKHKHNVKQFFLMPFGHIHTKCYEKYKNEMICVESGIGYPHTFAQFKVFESYAWLHHLHNRDSPSKQHWQDTVIPNCIIEDDFIFRDRDQKEDYFLFFGRLISTKGLPIAIDICTRLNKKLVVIGQGDIAPFICNLSSKQKKNIEFLGSITNDKEKAEIISKAKCAILPTYYIEPFGNVSIEAMISGVPIITTDWGCFAENNIHGITGFRCRTFYDFLESVKNIDIINPIDCRNFVLRNFTVPIVAEKYHQYFQRLHMMQTDPRGWYTLNEHNKYDLSLNHLYKELSIK